MNYGLDSNRVHRGCDFTAYEDNFGAIHRFMGCNVSMNAELESPAADSSLPGGMDVTSDEPSKPPSGKSPEPSRVT